MSALYQRPEWVTRLNYLGDSLMGAENVVALDAEEMMETAVRLIGAEDFGDDAWREPYLRMVDAIAAEANLHVVGRLLTRGEIIRCLCTRLILVDRHKKDVGLGAVQLDRPVFICGPSRTGTTILHELLAIDPQLRAPKAWETLHPVERPDLIQHGVDQRPAIGECEQEIWQDIQPEFAAIHELRSRLPMECWTIMAPEFTVGHWGTVLDVPGFMAWRGAQDSIGGYRFHKYFMQVLQTESWARLPAGVSPPRWVFKSPVHLGHFNNLFSIYPDARVIHTHRDPAKILASTISTTSTTRFIRTDHVRVDELAAGVAFGFEFMLKQTMVERKEGVVSDSQIADLHFQSLIRDPVGAIEQVYEKLDLEFTESYAQAITQYLAEKPQGKHGKHRYTLEQYGLVESEVRENFREYTEYYDIELES